MDFSGSISELSQISIDGIGDKALSAGETSKVTGKNIYIENAEIGIASKDFSEVNLSDVKIKDTKLGFAVFKKKETRNKNKNEQNKSLDIKIVNYKVLNKTGDMAIIISKLKEIRDHKISKIKEKKHSNKIKQEIRKLNETIALAEDGLQVI